MTLAVDITALREPGLWASGRQPLGPVKIDWSNPITKNLVVCMLPSQKCDLVTKTPFSSVGTTLKQGSSHGLGVTTSASLSQSRLVGGAPAAIGTGALTIASGVVFTGTPVSYEYACGMGNSSLNDGISLCPYHDAGDTAAYMTGLGYRSLVSPYGYDVVGNCRPLIQSFSRTGVGGVSSETFKLHVDGALRTTWTGQTNGNVAANNFVLGNIADQNQSFGANRFIVLFGYLWARELTEGAQASLARDPYQFLIPA